MNAQSFNGLSDSWLPTFGVGPIEVFNAASGLSVTGIGALITSITLGMIYAFGLWIMVGAIRQWMRGDDDTLSVFFSVVRGVLIVVVVTALLSISME